MIAGGGDEDALLSTFDNLPAAEIYNKKGNSRKEIPFSFPSGRSLNCSGKYKLQFVDFTSVVHIIVVKLVNFQ